MNMYYIYNVKIYIPLKDIFTQLYEFCYNF